MSKIKFSDKKLKEIAENYGLIEVYLFGSKITGFEREGSDLDVAVRFEDGLPAIAQRGKVYGDIFADLSSIFQGEKIDLSFIEEAPLHLQFKIVSEGEMIYSKEKNQSLNFLEKIVNQYRDYKFFIDEYFQGVLARKI
ncbi:MAG: nucleotidyltransferase domain-containing protein [Patescibacteria group bacterium]